MHSPNFDQIVGPHMSDRALLGLPETYKPLRAMYDPNDLVERAKAGPAGWTDQIQDPASPPEARMIAGLFLALFGDPRIDTLNPEMCSIAGTQAEVGLDDAHLEPTLSSMKGLGINSDWIRKEMPRHSVRLSDYRIGRYPVTNQEYQDFLLDTDETEIPDTWRFGRYSQTQANHPVHTVTAEAAQRYCDWLAARTGRTFRLPTEAEWEYAAAGAGGREFPWGHAFQADHANTAEEGYIASSPVGAFPAGRAWCGADGMAGNVEEYTSDLYGPYSGAEKIHDDLSLQRRDYHVARGGSYTRFFDLARTRRRHGHYLRDIYVMGFRLAETA